jgi:two-component system, sensor histidine kinase PdtaS
MPRVLLIAFVLLNASLLSPAQPPTDRSPGELRLLLQKSRPDTNRVQWQLQLSDYYLNKPDEYKNDLDSALMLALEALRLSDSLRYTSGRYLSLGELGRIFFERGDPVRGKASFTQVADFYHRTGNWQEELKWLRYFAIFMPERDASYPEKVNIFNRMLSVSRQAKDPPGEASALRDIADVYLRWGKLDTAEIKLLQLLRLEQSAGIRKLHYTYDLLATTSMYQGNYNKALPYALETIRHMQSTRDSASAPVFYNRIGSIYRELGQHENSIPWYRKALDHMQPGQMGRYTVAGHLARAMIKTGRGKDALAMLLDLVQKRPPVALVDKEEVAGALGDCFNALQQYDLAEKHYREMIHFEEQQPLGANRHPLEMYYVIGKFYTDRREYNKANVYLQKALALPTIKNNFASRIKDVHLALFKVDSAAGNYLSAIQHLRTYNILNDSIFSETKSKQIAELQIRYETARQEQDIKLLRNEGQLERNKLQQARLARNVTLAGIVMLLAIVGLLYNRYRLKQRSNRRLEEQQKEINLKNRSLEELLHEKDRLLEEKEWLLKEIHHRVKNNLQIVMSLLNTQSAYIENDAALVVIRENQHRVYAMSLIHQKLYQSEDVALIDIPVYISELMDYLRSSFDTRHIRFDLDIAPVKLDVAQTVPMGLILNEAVTNAIKYAFPGSRSGLIAVTLRQAGNRDLELIIEDNGVGLPGEMDINQTDSLGMSLMQGLSRQLGGSFRLENKQGLTITVAFVDERMTHPDAVRAASDLLTEIVSYE